MSRISAIVVSYNRADDLRESLAALRDAAEPSPQLVVVDNASTDGSPEVVGDATLLRQTENLGFAEANNVGLRATDGEYVALVNNDAVVAPGWADELAAVLDAHPDAAAAGGKQYFWDERNPLGSRENGYFGAMRVDPATAATPPERDTPDGLRDVATLSGCAVLVRRRAIDEVGAPFLDPAYFMYYEETDFFARALRRGWRLLYAGEPACWHRGQPEGGTLPYRVHYYLLRNRLRFAYRHFDDEALQRVVTRLRRKARAARLKRLVRAGDKHRALADGWAWAKEHAALLDEERARFAGYGGDYLAAVRALQDEAVSS